MQRKRIVLALAVLLPLVLLLVFWEEIWSPLARAREVAEIVSGREARALSGQRWESAPRRLWLQIRGIDPSLYAADREGWANGEIPRLRRDHPRILAWVAGGEPNHWVRCHLLQDADVDLEDVAFYGILRFDRDAAHPITEAERAALLSDSSTAQRLLQSRLKEGHCGALVGYEALGADPSPADLQRAGSALEAMKQDPASPLTSSEQEHCREVFRARTVGSAGR